MIPERIPLSVFSGVENPQSYADRACRSGLQLVQRTLRVSAGETSALAALSLWSALSLRSTAAVYRIGQRLTKPLLVVRGIKSPVIPGFHLGSMAPWALIGVLIDNLLGTANLGSVRSTLLL